MALLVGLDAAGRLEARGVHRARGDVRRREGLQVSAIDVPAAVDHLVTLEWLAWGPISTREAYTAALYPHDTPGDAHSMARAQSSCGLVCEAALRAGGCDAAWLRLPYASSLHGTRYPAVVAQETAARQRGVWIDALRGTDARPQVGDMVRIGGDTPGVTWSDPGVYAGAHVLTVIGIDGDHVESIDGGQTDAANGGRPTAIRRVSRVLATRGDALWLVSPSTGRGRRVAGWIDVAAWS